jgi:F-type H+-transporting ATPase subunit delta
MRETRIARRYAKALFDFAEEQNILERVMDDMSLVLQVCKTSRDFTLVLISPIIKFDKKLLIVSKLFEKHLHKVTFLYLQIIIRKKRERYIPDIAKQYIREFKRYKGISTVELKTAYVADDEIKQKILMLLKRFTDDEIELIEKVDKDLIGGFVLNFDDKQFDSSILMQLQQLKRNFDINIYRKGI